MEILQSCPTRQTSGFSKYQNDLYKRNYNVNLIREIACGNWLFILESLSVPVIYLRNKHGSCPICQAGKDRFRFDDKGKGLYFCNKCGAGDGFTLLQLYHGWSFPYTLRCVAKVLGHQHGYHANPRHVSQYIKEMSQPVAITDDEIRKRKRHLNATWRAAKLISQNDPVDCYLKARGITFVSFPPVLKFHPSLPYYNEEKNLIGYFPAMLGMVQEKNGRCVTIHRTYLGNSYKANVPQPKKMMTPVYPRATQGAAIKLFEPVSGKLALAEGIETALAFYIATQMPVWATISAGGMESIKLPHSITDVTIAVDNDESGRGQKAALVLAKRLVIEGRVVKRVMPPKVGYDFADMLVEENQ
jgi:putative DNA primase/helicase